MRFRLLHLFGIYTFSANSLYNAIIASDVAEVQNITRHYFRPSYQKTQSCGPLNLLLEASKDSELYACILNTYWAEFDPVAQKEALNICIQTKKIELFFTFSEFSEYVLSECSQHYNSLAEGFFELYNANIFYHENQDYYQALIEHSEQAIPLAESLIMLHNANISYRENEAFYQKVIKRIIQAFNQSSPPDANSVKKLVQGFITLYNGIPAATSAEKPSIEPIALSEPISDLSLSILHEKNDLDSAKKLIELQHININGSNDLQGSTYMHEAVKRGNLSYMQFLKQLGAELSIPDHNGLTPLHFAVKSQNIALTDWLLTQGALVNATESYLNRTPLHFAASQGSQSIVSSLLAYGADSSLKDSSHRTPLHYALYDAQNKVKPKETYYHDLAVLLIEKNGLRTPLRGVHYLNLIFNALQYRARSLIQAIDCHSVKLNSLSTTLNGNILHFVLPRMPKDGLLKNEIAWLITTFKFAINASDSNGNKPLHLVTNADDAKVVLENGGNLASCNHEGLPPLFTATKNKLLDVCEYLIQQGANPYIVDEYQRNIIHHAKTDYSSHNPFSKQLKKAISLPKEILDKLSNQFNAIIQLSQDLASKQNKKIQFFIGESHGDYRIYQAIKKFLNAALLANIEHLHVEFSQQHNLNNTIYMPVRWAKRHTKLQLHAVDNYRAHNSSQNFNTSAEGMKFRNLGIIDTINEIDQSATMITGASHLKGFFEDNVSKIDFKHFVAIPLNFLPLMRKMTSLQNVLGLPNNFENDPTKCIQVSSNGINLKEAKKVIRKWNP